MTQLKMKEINEMSEDDLKLKAEDLSKELYQLRCDLKITRKLEKPHLITQKKRERARILTRLNQKKS